MLAFVDSSDHPWMDKWFFLHRGLKMKEVKNAEVRLMIAKLIRARKGQILIKCHCREGEKKPLEQAGKAKRVHLRLL